MTSPSSRTTPVTLLTGSLGPHQQTSVSLTLPDGILTPPLLIEDPAPGFSGAWRRVTPDGADPAYVRVARIAAP